MSDMPAVSAQSPLQPGARVSPNDPARPVMAQDPSMPSPATITNHALITQSAPAGPQPGPYAILMSDSIGAANGGQVSGMPPQQGRVIPVAPPGQAHGAPLDPAYD